MAYIGQTLTEGIRRAYTFTATASQTTFNAVYGVGAVDVYQNGILLQPADYTATTGTTVVLAVGAAVNDEITIIAHNTFSVADTVSSSQGGTFVGDVTNSGNVGINTTPTAKLHINTGTSVNDFDQVLIEGSSNSTSSNPEITLKRNDPIPLDNDYIGGINFYGKNSADEDIKYAQIVGRAIDVSDATEDGAFAVFCESAATLRETLFVSGSDSRLRTNNLRIASHVTSGENSAGPTIGLIRNDTTVYSGDVLGTIGFGHFDGTPDFPSQTPQQLPASIRSVAAETQGSGDEGANMEFYTKPINANKDVSSTLNMKISNDGSITMPNQPSFSAYRDAGHVTAGNVYVFDHTNHNIGSMYDTSNGRATVPVDGRYFLGVWLMTDNDATYNNKYFRIRINNANPAYKNVYSSNGGSVHHQFSWAGVINLNANDYVEIYIDNFTAYGTDDKYSNFSMTLLS